MCRGNARPSPQLILQHYAASMLKLFGQTRSRASRSLWMLEEIGIPYEHMPVQPYTESRSAEYLHINPNGHIPSLEDDGFVLWELRSTCISPRPMRARRCGRQAPRDHALVYQWSLWVANEIEPCIVSIAKGL